MSGIDDREVDGMGVCRSHCPSGGHASIVRDALLFGALVVVSLKVASLAAPLVSWAVGAVMSVVLVGVVGVATAGVAWWAVVTVLNRRALARFAALEREAWLERQAPAAALAGGARELEATPVVRAKAFRVDELARDAA